MSFKKLQINNKKKGIIRILLDCFEILTSISIKSFCMNNRDGFFFLFRYFNTGPEMFGIIKTLNYSKVEEHIGRKVGIKKQNKYNDSSIIMGRIMKIIHICSQTCSESMKWRRIYRLKRYLKNSKYYFTCPNHVGLNDNISFLNS